MKPGLVIAIDGPSGSGKSSTSRGVAQQLGLAYLDTGSMYRAFTHFGLACGVDPDDAGQVAAAIGGMDLRIEPSPDHFRVLVAGVDLTGELHTTRISGEVSRFARVPSIRDFLTARMQEIIAAKRRIVVEGRDITTVVAPDADVRVLLVADAEKRVARRAAQLGGNQDSELVTRQVIGRDLADSQVNDFQRPSQGVVVVDSSVLGLDEVIAAVIELVPERLR